MYVCMYVYTADRRRSLMTGRRYVVGLLDAECIYGHITLRCRGVYKGCEMAFVRDRVAWWHNGRASDFRPRGHRFDPGRGVAA